MEILKASNNLLKALYGLLCARFSVYQLFLAIISYQCLKGTVFGGLHVHQWVKVSFISGSAYLAELMSNAPIIGSIF